MNYEFHLEEEIIWALNNDLFNKYYFDKIEKRLFIKLSNLKALGFQNV